MTDVLCALMFANRQRPDWGVCGERNLFCLCCELGGQARLQAGRGFFVDHVGLRCFVERLIHERERGFCSCVIFSKYKLFKFFDRGFKRLFF